MAQAEDSGRCSSASKELQKGCAAKEGTLPPLAKCPHHPPPLCLPQGFAIGSAALVSLALFGAYVTRAGISIADSSILDPEVCGGGFG